jgi:hypothetical protein
MHTSLPHVTSPDAAFSDVSMIVDPSSLRAALQRLADTKGCECGQRAVNVSELPRDFAPAAYLVTLTAACASRLSGDIARLTGRLLLPHQLTWVLFQHEAELILSYLGNPGSAN